MTEEIKSIIEKNLPAQVGDTLRKRLEQADKDAARVKQLEDILCNRDKFISNLENQIQDYKKLDERNSNLDAREKAIQEREWKQDVWEANLKVAEMEKRIVDNTNFVGMVFKSPIFRKTVSESIGGYQTWNNQLGRNEFIPDGNKSKTETNDEI